MPITCPQPTEMLFSASQHHIERPFEGDSSKFTRNNIVKSKYNPLNSCIQFISIQPQSPEQSVGERFKYNFLLDKIKKHHPTWDFFQKEFKNTVEGILTYLVEYRAYIKELLFSYDDEEFTIILLFENNQRFYISKYIDFLENEMLNDEVVYTFSKNKRPVAAGVQLIQNLPTKIKELLSTFEDIS